MHRLVSFLVVCLMVFGSFALINAVHLEEEQVEQKPTYSFEDCKQSAALRREGNLDYSKAASRCIQFLKCVEVGC